MKGWEPVVEPDRLERIRKFQAEIDAAGMGDPRDAQLLAMREALIAARDWIEDASGDNQEVLARIEAALLDKGDAAMRNALPLYLALEEAARASHPPDELACDDARTHRALAALDAWKRGEK